MDLVSRLKQYLDNEGIGVTQFADECNIPRPTASQLLAGRNKKVSDEIIGKIHQSYPNLSVVWLMFGEGNMIVSSSDAASSSMSQTVAEPTPYKVTTVKQEVEYVDVNSGSGMQSDKSNANSNNKFNLQNQNRKEFSFTNEDKSSLQNKSEGVNSEEGANMFAFADANDENSNTTSTSENLEDTITFKTGTGKRVTGIVVYYDDMTYESFIPDPDHGHPFICR